MNRLQEAIVLNNMGVAFYHGEGSISSRCAIGIQVFQRAMTVLQDFMSEHAAAASSKPSAGAMTIALPCAMEPMEVEKSHGRRAAHEARHNLGVRPSDNYFLYNRPMTIPTAESISSADEMIAMVVITSISLTFNLALMWHQLGESAGIQTYKGRAARLYDVIMINDNNLEGLSFDVLKCLVLNNRAHLYYTACDHDNSERCAAEMCSTLAHSADALSSYIDTDELDEIRFNVVYLLPPTVARSA